MDIKKKLKRILPKKWVTQYRISKLLGYKININNPQTFNEKIQWMKLYYRSNDLSIFADKVAVRDFVTKTIGEEYLIPLQQIFNSYKEINFSKLPQKFALKAAHGSKWNIICHDKTKLIQDEFERAIKLWGTSNYYWFGYEQAYKKIPPRFICEHLIFDHNNQTPNDYKIFCFNGSPKFIQVDTNRFSDHKRLIFDAEWNKQHFELGFESSTEEITRPRKLQEMLNIAESLSKGFYFVRIDLYDCQDQIYFGEMTFYPGEGSERFKPQKWDLTFGKMLTLPI